MTKIAQVLAAWKLQGSAPSLDGIKKAIEKFWYTNNVVLTPVKDNEWSVANAKGVVDGCRVIFKGGRYRFEFESGK